MITSRHIEKIVAVIVALAVILCMLAEVFSDTLSETLGIDKKGFSMEYETKLFDTSSVMDIDIQMDEDKWNEMLENAINEEYYQCNIVINGETFYNVGIRPKGNTSLSTIANDPDTVRYSFKIEFDKYVDGQTCYGLDKLVLNNNYADAANMKEAVVYGMFQKLGADSSLYNYADISVNGETWGVYLALEAVEDSFMLRNFGTEDGEIYKPDSMNFGGAGGMKDRSEDELNEMAEKFFGSSEETTQTVELTTAAAGNMQPPDANANPFGGGMPSEMQGGFTPPEMGGEMPDMGNRPQMPNMEGIPQMPDMNGEMPSMPDEGSTSEQSNGSETATAPSMENMPQMPDMENFPAMDNMPNMGGRDGTGSGGGSDLNYTDDSLDSYSAIWDGEVTSTSESDHKRVVEALKNISEQNNIEEYLDVENMLRYMAVHTFAVNLDSLSGSMTHNYYLYEENGRLNLLPWDYNLAFGGFSQGRNGSGATSTVNFPIDTPFSSGISLEDRQLFAALLQNEEYLAQYHEYLRILCEEYVENGELEALYNSIRANIDSLIENDPNAFYSYDEYDTAAETLMQVISLRSESIKGQLNGTIPSTTDGQNADPATLIDASSIDLGVLGTMSMGGGDMGGRGAKDFAFNSDETVSDGSSASAEAPASDENNPFLTKDVPQTQSDGTGDSSEPYGNLSSLTEGSGEFAERPQRGSMGRTSGIMPQSSASFDTDLWIWLGISLAAIAAAIIIAKVYKRRKK